MCSSRWREGAHLDGNNGRTTGWSIVGPRFGSWTEKKFSRGPILSRILWFRRACYTVSRSGGGRKNYCWWCPVRRRRPCWSCRVKGELQHLIGQFSDVFSPLPGQTNVIQHDIQTPPGVIVRQRPYRVPEARRRAIEGEIHQMLKLGVIEPSHSPWSSPIVLVRKPDGTLRFCNDYRRLNEVSQFDG